MRTIKCYVPALVALLSLAACSKNEETVYPEDGGLAFYNASQILREEVQGEVKRARILLNTNNPADSMAAVYMPDFIPAFGGGESQQFFPRKAISNVSPPWLGYMHIAPGMQRIYFLGTDSSFRAETTVQTYTDRNFCILLSDSMGTYHVTLAEENSDPGKQSVQLKVLNLCPDAGPLDLKVNDAQYQQLAYRGQTSFLDFETPTNNETFLLRVQLMSGADLAGRTTITATPGHSYTLIINGYYNTAAYTDIHTGKQISVLPDFRLSVVRNK